MDAFPPPPAVIQFEEKCRENTQSMLLTSGGGYSAHVRTWHEDTPVLMKRLNDLPLHSLQLAGTAVSDRQLHLFQNTQTLKSLTLWNMPIDGSGLDTLPICESVENLSIDNCMLNGKRLIGLRKSPNSKRLKMEVWIHSDDAIRHVSSMKALESLTVVTRDNLSGDGLEGVKGNLHLGYLDLSDTSVSRGFGNLADCSSLTHLNISNTKVDDASLRDVSKIASLKSLYVGSDKITGRGLLCFSGHPCLESLGYYGQGKGAEHIGITEDFFVHLISIPKLRHLHVACKVTPRGLSTLQNLKNLNSLTVNWPTLTREELEYIRKQLPNCRVRSRFLRPAVVHPEEDE